MTARDYVRVIVERWRIVALAVLLGILAAGAAFGLRPPTYTARLSMYVSATGAEDAAAAAYGAQLALQRVKSYVVLVGSNRVAQDVIEKLHLSDTPDALAKRITASTPVDSTIIDIEVSDGSPQRAAAITNAVASDFTDVAAEVTRNSQIGQSTVALRIVQPAAVPASPSSPGLAVTLAFGVLSGLVIGVSGALIRNALDTSIRTPGSLREAAGAPVLGILGDERKDLPASLHSDEIRKVRTNLRFGRTDPVDLVLVTSSVAGEGKTTTAISLAEAMSAAGSRVLLVEGDLRHPVLAQRLGLNGSVGLSTVLAGTISASEAVQSAENRSFDVLTSGPVPIDPSDLLAGKSLETLLRELRQRYEAVIVDSAPLLPYADAAIIAAAVDGVVLVCRSHAVTRAQVEAATSALQSASAPLLGTVLVSTGKKAEKRPAAEGPSDHPVPTSPVVPTPSRNGRPSPHPRPQPVEPPEPSTAPSD